MKVITETLAYRRESMESSGIGENHSPESAHPR